jgi:hypothetical protein
MSRTVGGTLAGQVADQVEGRGLVSGDVKEGRNPQKVEHVPDRRRHAVQGQLPAGLLEGLVRAHQPGDAAGVDRLRTLQVQQNLVTVAIGAQQRQERVRVWRQTPQAHRPGAAQAEKQIVVQRQKS